MPTLPTTIRALAAKDEQVDVRDIDGAVVVGVTNNSYERAFSAEVTLSPTEAGDLMVALLAHGGGLTDEQLIALVSDSSMWAVIHGLKDRIAAHNTAALPTVVATACIQDATLKEAIAEHGAPVTFVWHTSEYENGYFFNGHHVWVSFVDGEKEELEVNFDEILTAIRGDQDDPPNSTTTLTYEVATSSFTID